MAQQFKRATAGAAAALRGFDFQELAFLYYSLLRFNAHPTLEVHLETIEDAVFRYPSEENTVEEWVQCKSRERTGSSHGGRGDSELLIPVGELTRAHLAEILKKRFLQARDPNVFFTGIVSGRLSRRVEKYAPPGFKWAPIGSAYQSAERLHEHFPPDYVHEGDPEANLQNTTGSKEQRVRVRLISSPTSQDLEGACARILVTYYQIPDHRAPDAVAHLAATYHERSAQGDPQKNPVTLLDVRGLLRPFSAPAGNWISADTWLQRMSLSPADYNRGEPPNWADFAAGRYVRRTEFDLGIGLLESLFVMVHGYGGAGKTTLTRYLTYEFLSQNLDAEGFYLRVLPGSNLELEEAFFKSRLSKSTLFVLDDEQMAPDAVARVVGHFLRQMRAGRTRARVVVTTTKGNHFTRQIGRASSFEDPLIQAEAVRFHENTSAEELTTFLEAMMRNCNLVARIPASRIAALAGGHVGMALVMARASAGLEDFKTVQRLFALGDLKTLIESFVREKLVLGSDDDKYLTKDVLPVLILQGLGLPLLDQFERGHRLLERGGLATDADRSTPDRQTSLSTTLVRFLVPAGMAHLAAAACRKLLSSEPTLLPAVMQRLANSLYCQEALLILLDEERDLVLRILREMDSPLNLGQIAQVLASARNTSDRGWRARELFHDLATPRGEAAPAFFADYLRQSRVNSLRDVCAFFSTLFAIDRTRLRTLAVDPTAGLRTRFDFLLELCTSPAETLVEIARMLRALYLVEAELARQLLGRLDLEGEFQRKIANTEHEGATSELARYAVLAYPIDRVRVGDFVRRMLDPTRLAALYRNTPKPRLFFESLAELQRIQPRLATDVLLHIYRTDFEGLRSRLEHTADFKSLTLEIGLLARLSRAVGAQVARRLVSLLEARATKVTSYRVAGELVQIAAIGGHRLAAQLARALDRTSLLESIARESDHLNLVGRSLENFLTVDEELATWLAEHACLRELIAMVTRRPLLNVAYLLGGFCSVASFQGREDRIAEYLDDDQIRDAFKGAWAAHDSVVETASCLAALDGGGLRPKQIGALIGRNEPELYRDVLRRLERGSTLSASTQLVFQLAKLFPSVARDILAHVVETIGLAAAENAVGEKGSTRGRRQFDKAAVPRDFVELGAALQLAAAIDRTLALQLAQAIDLPWLATRLHAEPHFARMAAFVAGLHEASRKLSLEFIDDVSPQAIAHGFLDEDNVASAPNLARVLCKLSKRRGQAFVEYLVTSGHAKEISEHLRAQMGLTHIVAWLRILKHALSDVDALVDGLTDAVAEAAEYDGRLPNLLNATYGLFETGRHASAARKFLHRSADAAGQLRTLRSLDRIPSCLLSSLHFEHGLGVVGFTAGLMSNVPPERLSMLLLRATLDRVGEELLTAAFVVHCATEHPSAFTREQLSVVGTRRIELVKSARHLDRRSYRGLATVLLEPLQAEAVQAELAPASFLDRAYLHGIVELVGSVATVHVLPDDRLFLDVESGAAGRHARNVDFGFVRRFACKAGLETPTLRSAARERAGDEGSAPLTWLLSEAPPPTAAFRRSYYLWALLSQSVLRGSQFPWQDECRSAGEYFLQGSRGDYRWSPSAVIETTLDK